MNTGIDEVIRLSEAMLECAHAEDWDAFARLETQRDHAIRTAFAPPLELPAERFEAKVRIIQEMDEKLVAVSRQHRNGLQQEVLTLVRARKSARAYNTD
ncbi:flagellar protein FliT [Thiocystis violacea]|uniref:flagellar protein FliT n=1 Tax=Thiocystis violacea TaxID=13725 RepID=UPI001906D8DE|nr:flagellar protein FliT [Thiocystis violacea]MBK1722641.1 hypothetical protein [Thiocystis violacea]